MILIVALLSIVGLITAGALICILGIALNLRKLRQLLEKMEREA